MQRVREAFGILARVRRGWRQRAAIGIWLLSLAGSADATPLLFATGNGSTALSGFYQVDTATGAATLLKQYPDLYLYQGGLVYDPVRDVFFASGFNVNSTGVSRLYSLDPVSYAATEVGVMGVNTANYGMARNPITGVIYATGDNTLQSTALYTVDPTTGATTFVGQNGSSCCSTQNFGTRIAGLGFLDDGTLYGNGFYITAGGSMLWTISLTTGWATPIGSHGLSLGGQMNYGDMAYLDGVLYAAGDSTASTQGLYSVNRTTGAATLIGQTGPIARGGLAFRTPAPTSGPTPVPEPTTLSLFVLGGAGLFRRLRRGRT